MVTREKLQEIHPDEDLLFADGFDAAILGVVRRFGEGGHVCVVLYDRAKAIEILIAGGLTREEAEEHFGYNVADAYMGRETPAWAELATATDPDSIGEWADATLPTRA